jgi:hypothetical protein
MKTEKQEKKIWTKKIRVGAFSTDVIVVVSDDPSPFLTKKKLYGWDDVEEGANPFDEGKAGSCIFRKRSIYMIIPTWVSAATIAHECVHAVSYTLSWIGDKHDYDNDEVFAYHVGWLVGEVVDFVEKVDKLNKKDAPEASETSVKEESV